MDNHEIHDMFVEEFANKLGSLIYIGEIVEYEEYGESAGSTIAIIENDGGYKIIEASWCDDPWSAACFNQDEQAEILSAPWLNRDQLLRELVENRAFDCDADEFFKALGAIGASRKDLPPRKS